MKDNKCNCGKPVRYSHNKVGDTGEMKGSCNKYSICPTYEELTQINQKNAMSLRQIARILDKPTHDWSKLIDIESVLPDWVRKVMETERKFIEEGNYERQ
jgi:hypothetical protein